MKILMIVQQCTFPPSNLSIKKDFSENRLLNLYTPEINEDHFNRSEQEIFPKEINGEGNGGKKSTSIFSFQ